MSNCLVPGCESKRPITTGNVCGYHYNIWRTWIRNGRKVKQTSGMRRAVEQWGPPHRITFKKTEYRDLHLVCGHTVNRSVVDGVRCDTANCTQCLVDELKKVIRVLGRGEKV